MMEYILPILLLVLLLLGCSEPKIDASSDETLETSIEKVKDNLNENEVNEFEESLQFIAMQNLDLSDILQSGVDPDEIGSRFLNKIKNEVDGKTASEIISKADNLRKEFEGKQRIQALKEIKELEERKSKAKSAEEELSKFEIISSQFYRHGSGFVSQPIVELSVKNNTDYAISRAYFKGTYANPERQVPWLVEDFYKSISGGIEPGEEAILEIIPIDYSWDNLEEKKGAVLTVEVIRLDGPDGEELFNSEGLTEFEEERLNSLKEQFLEEAN